MLDKELTSLLAIVKDELGHQVLPSMEAGAQQQIVMCGQRILGCLVADLRRLPDLQAAAWRAYSGLCADLSRKLGEAEVKPLTDGLSAERSDPQLLEAVLQKISARLASLENDDEAHTLLGKVVQIENRLRADFLSACEAEITGGPHGGGSAAEGLSQDEMVRLRDWLRQRFESDAHLEIVGSRRIPGGLSKQTIFVSLKGVTSLPETVVLRIDWAGSPVRSTVVDEFQTIEALHREGVKVPQPFALEASGKVLGGPFLVLSKAEGRNIGDALDVHAGSPAFAADLARVLAKLHSIAPKTFGSDVNGADIETRERMAREIAAFESGWRALNEPSLTLETAFSWLKNHMDLAGGARSLIHKDVGCHNMLVKDDRVTALIDWEMAAIGNPAQDLGYAYPTVVQMCDWDDFMSAYAEVAVAVPSRAEIDYYTLWGYTWLNVMLLQARAAFVSGAAHDLRLGYATAYLLARLQARLSAKLTELLVL